MELTLENYYVGDQRRHLMRAMQYLMGMPDGHLQEVHFEYARNILMGMPEAQRPVLSIDSPSYFTARLRTDYETYRQANKNSGYYVTAYNEPFTHELLLDGIKNTLKTDALRGRILVMASAELREYIHAKYPVLPNPRFCNSKGSPGLQLELVYIEKLHSSLSSLWHMQQPRCIVVAMEVEKESHFQDFDVVLRMDLDYGGEILKHRDLGYGVPVSGGALRDTVSKPSASDPHYWKNAMAHLNEQLDGVEFRRYYQTLACMQQDDDLNVPKKENPVTLGSNAVYDHMKQAHRQVIDTYFTGDKHALLLEAIALLGDGQGNEIDVNDRYGTDPFGSRRRV